MATITFPGAVGTASRSAGQGLFARTLESFRRRLEIWQAEEELSAMSDRELADIGVNREQIADFVRRGR